MTAKTLLNYNFKGGVGKTTITAIQAYLMEKKGKKVLLVDFDPQASLTEILENTYGVYQKPHTSLLNGLLDNNLQECVVKMSDHVDLIKADENLDEFVHKVSNMNANVRYRILDNNLERFRDKYDYIFVDTPPSFNDIAANGVFAADFINIVMETEERSFSSAKKTLKKLVHLNNTYENHFEYLGATLYFYNGQKTSREVKDEAIKFFKGTTFDSMVVQQERVNRFQKYGISEDDYWSNHTLEPYIKLNNEIIEEIKKYN